MVWFIRRRGFIARFAKRGKMDGWMDSRELDDAVGMQGVFGELSFDGALHEWLWLHI